MTSPTELQPYVLRVEHDDHELGLRVGDRIVVTPGADEPVRVVRLLPANYGRLAGLLAIGAVRAITPDADAAVVRAVAAPSRRPPSVPPPPPHRLRVLRSPPPG